MELFIVNPGTENERDYSKYVIRKGFGWARNDLDSEKTTRLKNGTMRRDKITTKRKLSWSVFRMPEAVLRQMDIDLSQETFFLKYKDLHGVQTREFYCSTLAADLLSVSESGEGEWEIPSFNVIEV